MGKLHHVIIISFLKKHNGRERARINVELLHAVSLARLLQSPYQKSTTARQPAYPQQKLERCAQALTLNIISKSKSATQIDKW
jgi:hypothetical protein